MNDQFKVGDRVAIHGTILKIDPISVRVQLDDWEFDQFVTLDQLHPISTPPRWRAEKGETYYFIGDNIQTYHLCDNYTENSNGHYESGNYFKTGQQLEAALEKIKAVLKEQR